MPWTRSVSLALTLMCSCLVAGCFTSRSGQGEDGSIHPTVVPKVRAVPNLDETPLLVRFENNCPTEVIELLSSCDPDGGGGSACRHQGSKLNWVAVRDRAPPYHWVDLPFTIKFDSKGDPVEPRSCETADHGWARCNIRGNADLKMYYYTITSGHCAVLDPRIWVQ